jgi:hypothetical protein
MEIKVASEMDREEWDKIVDNSCMALVLSPPFKTVFGSDLKSSATGYK